MKKYDFTQICKDIAIDYEIKHSDYQRVLYKRDVVITEYRYNNTEFYAECHIDTYRIYRIKYKIQYEQFEVEVYSLTDSMLYMRKRK